MNLNLVIIKKELNLSCTDFHYLDDPTTFPCAYPILYDSEYHCEPDAVYICYSEQLRAYIDASSSPSFIVIGKINPEIGLLSCNYICLETSFTPLEILRKVQLIFKKYYQWETMMRKVHYQDLPLSEYGKITQSFIRNPFSLVTCAHQILFQYPGFPGKETSKLYQDYLNTYFKNKQRGTSIEEIDYLIMDNSYLATKSDLNPGIFSSKHYDYRWVYQNIFKNGRHVATLEIDEILYPITNFDIAIIKILGDVIQEELGHVTIERLYQTKEVLYLLDNLLSHKIVDDKKVADALKLLHWEINDTYFCITILRESDDRSTINSLIDQIATLSFDDTYILYDQSLVIVFRLSAHGNTKEIILQFLLPMLRDSFCYVGISLEFNDFKNLYYYYKQAQIALKIGRSQDPSFWSYHWENYELYYCLSKCKEELIEEALIPSGLLRLMEHDRRKSDRYIPLLRIYLDNERNIADTARAAYMHRNTCIYRLKRIEEILQMDLDNPEVRLLLQMCLNMLET